MPSQGTTLDWLDTPNPSEQAFTFTAKQDIGDVVPNFMSAPVLWTACPSWVKKAETIPLSLQGYTLVDSQKAGFQLRRFVFAKTRDEKERGTAFKTRWVKRMHSWPTVLLKLWGEKARLPLSTIDATGAIKNADDILVRSRYRPGGMFPTWFRVREFFSEKPFPRSTRQEVPILDSINWQFDGQRGGFPECLHPGVTIPNDSTTGQVVFGFGTEASDIGSDIVMQEHPPTNMTDWQEYVIEDTRRPVFGTAEHRIIVEAYPPFLNREIKV